MNAVRCIFPIAVLIASTSVAGAAHNGLKALSSSSLSSFRDAPTVTSIDPATTDVGKKITLTVKGTGFTMKSVIVLKGLGGVNFALPLTTTYVSDEELRVEVQLSATLRGSTPSVYVENADGATSNSMTLTINNPVPTVKSVDPNEIKADGMYHKVTIKGFGFTSGTYVNVNGQKVIGAQCSADTKSLTVMLWSNFFQAAGKLEITATNPGPGGGTSNSSVTITVK